MILKNKNIIFLIVIVALALIAWGFVRGNKLAEGTKFPKIKFSSKVDRIEIGKLGTNTVLVKEDGVWKVQQETGNLLADPAAVESIVEILDDFPYQDVVSTNADKYIDFEIVDAMATQVAWFRGDDEQGRIYFGKADYQRQGDYVRVGDQVPVYITEGNISFTFSRPDFRDLTVLAFDQSTITKVSLKYGETDEEIVLEKTQGLPIGDESEDGESQVPTEPQWFIAKDDTLLGADQSVVNGLLGQISNFTARNLIPNDPARDYGFSEPFMEINVTADDQEHVVIVGAQADEEPAYYVQVASNPDWVYLVHVAVVNDQLSKQETDFLPDAPVVEGEE